MSDIDPILTINGKLNLRAGIRLTGDEIKCWVPTQHGDGVLPIAMNADDCKDLGRAFAELGKKLRKNPDTAKINRITKKVKAELKSRAEARAKKESEVKAEVQPDSPVEVKPKRTSKSKTTK